MTPPDPAAIGRRHVAYGWWMLLAFLTLGAVLEGLHGFKAGFYLDVDGTMRRLMWTLAHAHGALLGLVNVAFGLTLRMHGGGATSWIPWASRAMAASALLLPGGFFLGGVVTHAGDPGIGILLVPPGAILLFAGVFLTARGAAR